jgi:hypothetical protein
MFDHPGALLAFVRAVVLEARLLDVFLLVTSRFSGREWDAPDCFFHPSLGRENNYMQILNPSRALVVFAALALLAGCSGGSTSTFAPGTTGGASYSQSQVRGLQHPELVTRPGIVAQSAHARPTVHADKNGYRGTVFVSDAGTNEVYLCKTALGCNSIGSGWSEPQGLAVSPKTGDVYVADTTNSRIVVLSQTGTVVRVLNDPNYYPVGVSISADAKTVGVTNICDVATCSQGNIVFYAKGATSPTSTATGLLARYYFGGFDASGNFYNDGEDANGGIHVGVVASGSTTDTDTGLGAGVSFPGGVIVGPETGLIIDDQTCPCARTYSLPGLRLTSTTAFNGASDPVTIGLNHRESSLYTADAGEEYAGVYDFPAGGNPTFTITGFSEPIGIGVYRAGTE